MALNSCSSIGPSSSMRVQQHDVAQMTGTAYSLRGQAEGGVCTTRLGQLVTHQVLSGHGTAVIRYEQLAFYADEQGEYEVSSSHFEVLITCCSSKGRYCVSVSADHPSPPGCRGRVKVSGPVAFLNECHRCLGYGGAGELRSRIVSPMTNYRLSFCEYGA